jgi:hypothetical protein
VVNAVKLKVAVPQLSVAVGVAQTGVAVHSIVDGPGNPEITGGVVSTTLMVCEAVAVLRQASVAVHVRVMLYAFGQEPDVVTSTDDNIGTPQASVAVGVVQEGAAEHWMVDVPGNPEITGAVTSTVLVIV